MLCARVNSVVCFFFATSPPFHAKDSSLEYIVSGIDEVFVFIFRPKKRENNSSFIVVRI